MHYTQQNTGFKILYKYLSLQPRTNALQFDFLVPMETSLLPGWGSATGGLWRELSWVCSKPSSAQRNHEVLAIALLPLPDLTSVWSGSDNRQVPTVGTTRWHGRGSSVSATQECQWGTAITTATRFLFTRTGPQTGYSENQILFFDGILAFASCSAKWIAVFVWSVTGPVFILETPLANAMKMISCWKKKKEETSHTVPLWS